MGASDDQPPDHSPFKVVCSVHDEVLIEREVGDRGQQEGLERELSRTTRQLITALVRLLQHDARPEGKPDGRSVCRDRGQD